MNTMVFPFNSFPELNTSRLLLRDLNDQDHEMMFFLRSDKTVNAYIKREGAKKLEDAIDFINMVQLGFKKGDNINWAICEKEDQKMIGSICFWNFSKNLKTGEIGYSLHPESQQKGIMNEAMRAVIEFGFSVLNFDRIVAYTHHKNIGSLQLLKKNGFILQKGMSDPGDENNRIFALERV